MFALILSVCMAPVNANGQEVVLQDVCEEVHISTHKTMLQCISSMDRNIEATKRSVFNSFDWMYSCEKEAKE